MSLYLAVYRLLRQFFNFRQGENKSNDSFLKCFLKLNSSLKQAEINTTKHNYLAKIETRMLLEEDDGLSTYEATNKVRI